MKRIRLACILAIGLILLFSQIASAHERRVVGKYQWVVGFLNEPAFAGQPNALDLRVTDAQTNQPITGLEQTLQAEVIFGDTRMPLGLRAQENQPGAYAADLVPTMDGTYVFHITGTIQGFPVDENFGSGPGRFSDVLNIEELEFPQRVPAATDLATQLQTEQDAVASARMIAIFGLLVGVIGLGAAVLAIWRAQQISQDLKDLQSNPNIKQT